MHKPSFFRLLDGAGIALFWSGVAYFSLSILLKAAMAFSWPKVEDVSFLYYLSWLMNEHDFVPYRDMYETSFPGTFLFHALVTHISGYSDVAFHVVDTFYLLALLGCTLLLLKPIHVRVAVVAVIYFALIYVYGKKSLHFQRDYLAILPVVMALLVAQRATRWPRLQMFAIGGLFACSAMVKPHFLVGLPIVAAYAFFGDTPLKEIVWRGLWQKFLFLLLGLLVVLLACVLWLAWSGGLQGFVEMSTQYLPLYLSLDSGFGEINSREYWRSLFKGVFDQAGYELKVAAITLIFMLLVKPSRLVITLYLLVLAYALYVFVAGKTWDYYWAPFGYFAAIFTSLMFTPVNAQLPPLVNRALMVCMACLFVQYVSLHRWYESPAVLKNNLEKFLAEKESYPFQNGNKQNLVDYLKTRTHPGEKIEVRVMGATSIVFPALLELQLLPASPHLLQFIFYHHLDHPYTQQKRRDLLEHINPSTRYLVDSNQAQYFPRVDGTPAFPEYDAFIARHYQQVYDNLAAADDPQEFMIYERRP